MHTACTGLLALGVIRILLINAQCCSGCGAVCMHPIPLIVLSKSMLLLVVQPLQKHSPLWLLKVQRQAQIYL